MLNLQYQQIIELKYEGNSYEEIASRIENKFSVGTLRNYFSRGGLLQAHYLEYADQQNQSRREESFTMFKREAVEATRAVLETFKAAVKQGDTKTVLRAAQVILDRGGIMPIKAANLEPKSELTEEEYLRECQRIGVDPYKLDPSFDRRKTQNSVQDLAATDC